MRVGLLLVSLAVLASPAAVGKAASDQPKVKASAKLKLPTGLRGSVQPSKAVPLAPAAARLLVKPPVLPSAPFAMAPPPGGQCRTDCAHGYYFCQSGPATIDCADTWSQCLSSCSYPPLTISH